MTKPDAHCICGRLAQTWLDRERIAYCWRCLCRRMVMEVG